MNQKKNSECLVVLRLTAASIITSDGLGGEIPKVEAFTICLPLSRYSVCLQSKSCYLKCMPSWKCFSQVKSPTLISVVLLSGAVL